MTLFKRAVLDISRFYVRYGRGEFGKAAIVRAFLDRGLQVHSRQVVASTGFGVRMRLDTQDLIQRYIYQFGFWEPHLTRWLQGRLRPGDVFVDVGANIGYLSLLTSQLVGATGRVVAIEASPEIHAYMLHNVRLNSCTNIRAVNTAVSDRREKLTFVLASSANMGATTIVPDEGPAESRFDADAQPLGSVLTESELNHARIIKIDVEGAEGAVMRGLSPRLGSLSADAEFVVEVSPERMEKLGDCVEELLGIFRSHGFHVYRLYNSYDPSTYPAGIWRAPQVPVRWRVPVTEQCDLVFSRIDAETLG